MKNLNILKTTFISVLFSINFGQDNNQSQAQDFKLRTYLEQTSVSPKQGVAFLYEARNRAHIGAFYQEHSKTFYHSAENTLPRFYEKEFFGIYMGVPFLSAFHNRLIVRSDFRTGIINREHFCITPSVVSSVKLAEPLTFDSGIGIRNGSPTYSISLTVKI